MSVRPLLKTAPTLQEKPRIGLLLALTLTSIVFPMNFMLGSLLLSPARILYLLVVPILIVQFFSGKYGRVTAVDVLVFCHIFWLVLTVFVNHQLSTAITYTGSNVSLILGGYLVGRTIQSTAQMRGAALFLVGLVIFSLPFAIVETRTSTMVLARLVDHIPGFYGNKDVNYDPRFGFNRVQFLFAHPIHYGLFCSCAFSLCFIGLRKYFSVVSRTLLSMGIALATFLSVSSGPFLALAMQICLIGWGWLFRSLNYRWRLLSGLGFAIYLVLEVLSNRPAIYAIVSKLAFSASTANDRRLLLEYGIAQIQRAPILGIGFRPFPLPFYMTGSIDNHWLLVCIVFGLPTFVFLIAALFLAFYRLGRIKQTDANFNDLRLAWNITMISLMLTLATVAIWTEMLSLFYFVIGSGIWMTTYRPENKPNAVPDEPVSQGRQNPYTRFPAQPDPRRVIIDRKAVSDDQI